MDAQLVQNGQNAKKIICVACGIDVLLPAHGTYVQQQISLPTGKDGGQESLNDFWLVNDIFDFQNIGFLRTVQNAKYLTCGSCERGVLGVQQLDNQNKIFLSHNRVTYKQ